jgi:hypothetical protein
MQPDRTVRVTTLGRSRAEDRDLRTRRYLLTQSVRLACVLLAVALPVAPVWKIGLIIGSIVLPWFGVVAANAGPTIDRRRTSSAVVTPVVAGPVPAIESTRIIDSD